MRCLGVAVVIVLLTVFATIALASPVTLDPGVPGYNLGGKAEILEDPSRKWTVDDVRAEPQASRFRPIEATGVSEGLSSSAWWLRVQLHNPSSQPQERIIEIGRGTITEVEMHYPPGFEPRMKKSGRFYAFSDRDVAYRNPAFTVVLPPETTTTLHARVWTDNEVAFPVRVWTMDGLRQQERDDYFVMALFYGAVLFLALYHLVLYARLRETYLALFGSYVAFFGVWVAFVDSVPYGVFERLAPALGTHAFVVFGYTSVILAMRFSQVFLDMRERLPRMHVFMNVVMALGLATILLSVTGIISWATVNQISGVVWLAVYPSLLLTGVLAWRAGIGSASWYTVAWTIWAYGGFHAALTVNGVLPLPASEASMPLRWAVLGEAVAMSIALAHRIQALGRETAEAHALTMAQGQLAEAERSAALGRLMAGLLHEVNSPLGALRSAAGTLGKTFDRVAKYVAPDERKAQRTIEAGHQLAGTIEESSERIGNVIDSLKRFVAVDEAEQKRVDVREGIEGALTLVSPTLEDAITVERELPEEPVMTLCKPAKLNHALLELLQSAIGRLADGGTLRVTVRGGEAPTIEIHDDGPALSDDALAHMFELGFAETEGRMRMRLGLPLAKQAIEEIGGSVTAQSGDEGTTTTVTLVR